MKIYQSFIFLFFCSNFVFGQDEDTTLVFKTIDVSTETLPLLPLAHLDTSLLDLHVAQSPVNLVNTIPGVRMEERSPGSYRLSIRGSAIRSPFGVRNVAVYLNNAPLSDAGGNTYLNLLDLKLLNGISIHKGPGASAFGAQSAGTVFLKHSQVDEENFDGELSAGNFNAYSKVSYQWRNEKHRQKVSLSHLNGFDSYRDHGQMVRTNLLYSDLWNYSVRASLSSTVFLGAINYQTPGGLTFDQFNTDPRQARQGNAFVPGAEEQEAAVDNQTVFFALSNHVKWRKIFENISTVFGSATLFENPFITNYEERKEGNIGLRSNFILGSPLAYKVKWNFGAEIQANRSAIENHDNLQGSKGALQSRDLVYAEKAFVFGGFSYAWNSKWNLNASLNFPLLMFQSKGKFPIYEEKMTRYVEDVFLLKQIGLTRKIGNLKMKLSYASGVSNPSLAEIRPSTQVFNLELKSQVTDNLEANFEIKSKGQRYLIKVNAYLSEIKNAIVRRNDSLGNDFFVNAGSITQNGIEAFVNFVPFINAKSEAILKLQVGQSYNYYRFKNYESETDNFSGNQLTGTPTYTSSFIAVVHPLSRLNILINYYYASKIFLNDANTAVANPYHLLQTTVDFALGKNKNINLYVHLDNLLNETYSLGNDINAFGGRYYNAAPSFNVISGIKVKL